MNSIFTTFCFLLQAFNIKHDKSKRKMGKIKSSFFCAKLQ